MIEIVTNENKRTYVTYGRKFNKKNFDINKIIIALLNNGINKPSLSFWGSPEDAEYGWKEYCEGNLFRTDYLTEDRKIIWQLKEGSKIFVINNMEDLNELVESDYLLNTEKEINFYKMRDCGYSAIELRNSDLGHMFINKLELIMNSWDCESICLLNKDNLVILEDLNYER